MTGPEKDYAAALFMLAVEENQTETYLEALNTVCRSVESEPAYLEFLSSPAVSLAERLSAIDEAFGTLPEHVVSFLKLLCENGHIRIAPACAKVFEELSQALKNRTTAHITSAVPLDAEQQKALCRKVEALTGKGIDAVYTVDDSLLGGVVIEVEGKTYDGSLKRRLHDVKDVMIR